MISKAGVAASLSTSTANSTKKLDNASKQQNTTTNSSEATKVEVLKEQIANDEYKVDLDLLAGVIADSLE